MQVGDDAMSLNVYVKSFIVRSELVKGPEADSRRWGDEEDANNLMQLMRLGLSPADAQKIRVITSTEPPEIFRHCGDAAQAIGSACFHCRKVLTVEMARTRQPQYISNSLLGKTQVNGSPALPLAADVAAVK
jgi:hypothetical protein